MSVAAGAAGAGAVGASVVTALDKSSAEVGRHSHRQILPL